jgi:23S rRNA pseudouridine1911/1915/1917 synthase
MSTLLSESIEIAEDQEEMRIDKVLSELFPTYSRTYFQFLIEQGAVLLNKQSVKKREKVKPGDVIDVDFLQTPELKLEPQELELDLLYEDEHLLAINKAQGMVVHPAPGHYDKTFVNALLFHLKDREELLSSSPLRPGIVHRLDKDTSGVLIAAKTSKMHQALVELFAARKMKKEYLAVTVGEPKVSCIDKPIGRHPIKRQEMCIAPEKGREATTYLSVLGSRAELSLVKASPVTGRTHQIRVHLRSIDTPILGDPLYGYAAINQKYELAGQLLHAYSLTFTHPITHEILHLKAPIPKKLFSLFPQLCAELI